MNGKRRVARGSARAFPTQRAVKHRWRFYATPGGQQPVGTFLRELTTQHATDAAAIADEMKNVQEKGTREARRISERIYEVRVEGDRVTYRVLFASQGSKGRILLGLHAFSKKTQATPKHVIKLAEDRLDDWERRGL
jgi:phage-related protein